MARKKRKYVVGYDRDDGLVWGPEYTCDPTTLGKAIQLRKRYRENSVIYELVPVDDDGRRLT